MKQTHHYNDGLGHPYCRNRNYDDVMTKNKEHVDCSRCKKALETRHLLSAGASVCTRDKFAVAGAIDGGSYGNLPVANCPDCLEWKAAQLIKQAARERAIRLGEENE